MTATKPASAVDELKEILGNFPGESDVVLEMARSAGRRTLKLDPSYRVSVNARSTRTRSRPRPASIPAAPVTAEGGAATSAV